MIGRRPRFCIHRPGREGVQRGGSVRVTSVRAGGVCWDNGDRSLPVSLDMWDGCRWKAVGDIGVDFKT